MPFKEYTDTSLRYVQSESKTRAPLSKKSALSPIFLHKDPFSDRELRSLDKEVAQTIGYKVTVFSGTDYYILVRPHSRASVPLGGLSTVSGNGPAKRIHGPLMSYLGLSPADAWDWVPHFTTNPVHSEALKTHVTYHFNLILQSSFTQPIQMCNEIIQKIKSN